MKSLRSFTCSAAMLLALLVPTAAVADDQGAPPGAAPPAEQAPPPPPAAETQADGDGADTLVIAGTLGGLLALAGVLIVVRERRRPVRGT